MDFSVATLCFVLDWLRDQEQAPDYRLAPPPLPPKSQPGFADAAGATSLADLGKPGGLFGLGLAALPAGVSEKTKTDTAVILKHAKNLAVQIELNAALDRIGRFEARLGTTSGLTAEEYRREARTLREAIEDDSKKRLFLYIPTERVKMMSALEEDWKKTIVAFKTTAKREVGFAIHCYVTGNATACVFHLMRAAEIGLRALARERRVTLAKNRQLAWGDWHELLVGIDKKVNLIANKKRGPARERALVFYQGILGEFEAFKDVYRNNVMHTRETYDMPRALSVLNHVREFMERLADKVGEDTTKQIKWGLR